MKICERGTAWVQVVDEKGNVRACCWARNTYLGNILEEDMESILNGRRARKFQKSLADGSYSNCRRDNCPYLANGTMGEHLAAYRHEKYPRFLYLAYEGRCNYRCTCCTSYRHIQKNKNMDYEKQYARIEEKLKPILPYVKEISANGRGELFASPHILKVLSQWKPVSPPEECSVLLETNGSLFDEKHWKQIENLGQYRLSVAITVMSFDEGTYQFLSGCKYPISKLEHSLHFVSGLRRKGIINHLEIATVLQEYNFREMPQFTRRCIHEFGADSVRIRPIVPGGPYTEAEQWFMDVRNPKHPYYPEYRRIMQDKIFEHPKVLLWSGGLASGNGDFPWHENKLKKIVHKGTRYLKTGKK